MSRAPTRRQFIGGAVATLPALMLGRTAYAGEVKPVVIGIESDRIQAGFAGDTAPRVTLPTVSATQGSSTDSAAVSPIQGGVVTSFAGLKTVLERTFTALNVRSTKAPVLLTEPALNPKVNREALCRMMFEDFHVPGFYLANEASLALFASGRTTGIAVIVGYDVTRVVPIFEGYALPHAVIRGDYGHEDMLAAWRKALNERGAGLVAGSGDATLADIDAHYGYVAVDFAAEQAKAPSEQSYTLPSGKKVSLARERYLAPEILFRPSLAGVQMEGVHKSLYAAVMKCDVDIRKDLYGNVVLCGSGSDYSGLQARLGAEVTALAPPSWQLNILAPTTRTQSVFIGGSLLTSESFFASSWVTPAEYAASGATIVHQRCQQ